MKEELVEQRCDEVLATGVANAAFSAQKGVMQKFQAAATEAAVHVSELMQKETTCEYLGDKQRGVRQTDPSQWKVTSQEKEAANAQIWFRWTSPELNVEEELVEQRCDEVLATGVANPACSKGLM